MSVQFFNIATGEEVSLNDPAHIAAYVNSSNMGKNSNKGQDFKWRISPELMAKVDEYSEDPAKLEEISKRLGVPLDALEVVHILSQIAYEQGIAERSARRALENNPAHAEAYEKRLEAAKSSAPAVQVVKSNKPAVKK